jgi:hypothetical protein
LFSSSRAQQALVAETPDGPTEPNSDESSSPSLGEVEQKNGKGDVVGKRTIEFHKAVDVGEFEIPVSQQARKSPIATRRILSGMVVETDLRRRCRALEALHSSNWA